MISGEKGAHDWMTVEQGQGFLIRPGESTIYQADSIQPWEYVWIAFGGDEPELMLEKCGLLRETYICKWDNVYNEEMIYYIKKIALVSGTRNYVEQTLKGYFYIIFAMIIQSMQQKKICINETYYDQAIKYIRHNYGYKISVSDIANHVKIERSYLYKIFKTQSNLSPKEFLTKYRIQMAKTMFDNTTLNVTEVAFSCGFQDLSTFNRKFKFFLGKSPKQYHKNKNYTKEKPIDI